MLAGCSQEPPPAPAPKAPAATAQTAAPSPGAEIGPALRKALGDDWEAHYFDAAIDLNGDGRREVIALVAGPMVCGTGGCPLFVFTLEPGGYRLVTQVSVVQPPVQASPRSSGAWRNLIVGIGGGGIPAGHAELKHDGEGYPSNPTVPPAGPAPGLEGAETLIPPFKSYRDGKPLPAPIVGAPKPYGDPNIPAAGKVLGMSVHTGDAEELRYVILRQLTDRYAAGHGIQVTQAEKAAYVARVGAALKQDREQKQARRDELSRQLASKGLPETQRKALTQELDQVNGFLAALAEPSGNPEESRAAREQVGEAFIRQWKINRALYQQYRGRIIFQQGGPEPLDAYRKFLEESQARGDFSILDKDQEAAFWRYYRDDSIHSFYPSGSKEEAEAFRNPPWEAK